MAVKRKPCGRELPSSMPGHDCPYERAPGKQQCIWHWLLKQSPEVQRLNAEKRRPDPDVVAFIARVPKEHWAPGERWCAGCQWMVPLFYCSGSRCKSCASEAAHASRIEKVYDISKDEYNDLLALQGGVCYVCHRKPKTKRLAVDHNHRTGEVRGLLCPDVERGCNHAVLGSLENSKDGALAAARRLVEYLEDPPYARLGRTIMIPSIERTPPESSQESISGHDPAWDDWFPS